MMMILDSDSIINHIASENFVRILVMHECCHGLGFMGLCNIVVVNVGQYSSESLTVAIEPLLNALVPFYGLVNINTLIPFWNDLINPVVPSTFSHTLMTTPLYSVSYGIMHQRWLTWSTGFGHPS
jgi:hypothetical protein